MCTRARSVSLLRVITFCDCRCSSPLALQSTVKVAGEQLYLAMVADGHGGKHAAVHCKKMIIGAIVGELGQKAPTGKAVRDAGRAAFARAHAEVLANDKTTAGSTLTCVVVNVDRAELTTLHSGDSVARLVPHHAKCVALCEDHRIDSSEAERDRLTKLGGQIARAMDSQGQPAGPLRLWPGGVAQARAIGDRDVGSLIDARPFVRSVPMPAETCCIVICSDGVWDALLPAAVDAIARRGLANSAKQAADTICNSALMQRHAYSNEGDALPRDDTTCIVIRVELEDDPIQTSQGCIGPCAAPRK